MTVCLAPIAPKPFDDRNEDGEGSDGDDEEHFRT
jgi:hypothetical protein